MKKLSKAQINQHSEIKTTIDEAINKLKEVSEEFAQEVQSLWENKVQPAIEGLDEAFERASKFKEDTTLKMQDYYDGRSERWTDGDAGQAYQSWLDAWNEFEKPDLEAELEPDEITQPIADLIEGAKEAGTAFEELPIEPEE